MTFKFLRPALAIALALTLGACGGKASFTIGGEISGLKYNGLVLSSNGMNLKVAANSTTFAFPNSISYGDVYEVTATAQPDHQTCTVGAFSDAAGKVTGGAKDTAGRLAAINVGVLCSLNAKSIGGTITGLPLAATGLQLTNGSDPATVSVTPTGADIPFTFTNLIPYGTTYGVTVLTQPVGAVCSVANGAAVMGDTAVTNIVVTCASTKSN